MKNLVAIIGSVLLGLSTSLLAVPIPGTIIAAKITTGDTANTFSIGDTVEMNGTPKQVADSTARDAISADRRSEGMTCWVIGESNEYRLVGGTNNSNWVLSSYSITNATYNYFYATNIVVTNLYVTTELYSTNQSTMAPDFNLGYAAIATNASFTFLAPINVDSTKTKVQTSVVVVTNSSGSTITVTAPTSCKSIGTMNVTNVTAFTFWVYPGILTNVYGVPIF